MIEGFVSPEALALMFLFFGLTIAVIIRNLKNTYSWIPYTPTLFLISIGLGFSCNKTGIIGQSIKQISKIDPREILLIFLPPLIFESSFNSDWYIFRKQSIQIFILAFPAVLVSALTIMLSIKVIIGYDIAYYSWSQAFMFGSVLSCTDTVAVLALLKQAGAPRKFNSLIEGQSLFNDGTCMVLFTISLELVKGNNPPPLYIVQLFLELTLGAIILGVIFGFLSSKLIRRVRNNAILTVNITVVSCYIIYFVAEYVKMGIQISGIMALVSLGIYMAAFGKTNIGPGTTQLVQNFWKIYIYIAETIIFILGGVIVGVQALRPQFIQMINAGNVQKLISLYFCMTLARFISISIFMPKLRSQGYGLKWKEVGALTYGGLRGAVGIAFTLILASNPSLNSKFRMISLFNTSGCAFLTLMINAPTCSFVIKKLGLCVKSDPKITFFCKFMKQCEYQLTKQLQQMRRTKLLENANWQKVRQYSCLKELENYIEHCMVSLQERKKYQHEKQVNELMHVLIDLQNRDKLYQHGFHDDVDLSLVEEIRNRYCVALKGILWQKFQNNQCSTQSIRVLIQCVNIDMDSIEQPLNSWDYLISHMHNPYFFPICYWLKNKPLIGSIAMSWIFQRVKFLYGVISTYLDALVDCQLACKSLPYDSYLQSKVVEQSTQNRKLAESFLDHEIKKSYYQIMKRIQTIKASQSILTFQKDIINNSYQYGQIEDEFYRELTQIIEDCSQKLQRDYYNKQHIKDIDILKQCQFFNDFNNNQLYKILSSKVDLLVQKDESVLKSYQRQKYVYLVVRGEIVEQYKSQNETLYSRKLGLYRLSGVGTILINNKLLEYSAIAQSVVTLYCFPINEMKQLISKKIKLEEKLQNDLFMLEAKVQPTIFNNLQFTENQWKIHRSHIIFHRIKKGQSFTVESLYLVLIFGKLKLGEETHLQGCFHITEQVTLEGPSKFYCCDLQAMKSQQEGKSQQHSSRISLTLVPKLTRQKSHDNEILKRTLFNKD